MKRIQYAVVALATVVMLLSVGAGIPVAIALAQDEEITLAGLAEQVTALAGRVTAIEERLAPAITSDGVCILLKDDFDIQTETATKFLETFDARPGDPHFIGAEFNANTGIIGFLYRETSDYSNFKYVMEYWDGCEFVGSSDWVQTKDE